MPELPEVEIVRRNLARWWVGGRVREFIVEDADVLKRGEVERLVGCVVERVVRRGKFLMVHFGEAGALVAVIHLRMTGKVVALAPGQDRARVRWRVSLEDGSGYAFVDTRRLGHLDVVAADGLDALGVLGRLGPEPWPAPVSGAALAERLGATRRPIKVALMDQEVVAGVGNIVAAESLWRARLDPRRLPASLSEAELDRLGRVVCEVCEAVIVAEESDEVAYIGDPDTPRAHNPFNVYRRSVCPRCQGAVARLTQSGRNTYWCPSCQR